MKINNKYQLIYKHGIKQELMRGVNKHQQQKYLNIKTYIKERVENMTPT